MGGIVMPKVVLLMRHAKSSWKDDSLPDQERPLAGRGKHDAERIGELLAKRGAAPDLIISSSAKRARSTAKRVAAKSGYSGEVRVEADLYGQGVGAYLWDLASLPETVERPLLIGHNPTMEEAVRWLTHQTIPMPTAAVACIELPIASWSEIASSPEGALLWTLRPDEA